LVHKGWSLLRAAKSVTLFSGRLNHAANPATLYAVTFGVVFKSTNGGGNWSLSYTGLKPNFVQALAIDPTNPATLYAGTKYAGTLGKGVYKSSNGGVDWSPFNTGLTYMGVQALAIDPANPATLYAGTSGGVFKISSTPSTVPAKLRRSIWKLILRR
jgi:hypothetical protein